jgi:hypothetical protein
MRRWFSSDTTGVARYTPHVVFDLPNIPTDAMACEMTELSATRPRPLF